MDLTARQLAEMAAHIRTCPVCSGDDPEIIASLNEGLPPDELADFITSAHDPQWRAFLDRHQPSERGFPCSPTSLRRSS